MSHFMSHFEGFEATRRLPDGQNASKNFTLTYRFLTVLEVDYSL